MTKDAQSAHPATDSRIPALDKHRLAGLQDGVYSIAMTLLVLELRLPPLDGNLTDTALWAALLSIWPRLLTWLLSFWVLAIFWIGDARALAAFRTVDQWLLRLGLWRIALVSLLPFSSALIGEHGDHVPAAALYAAHLFFLTLPQGIRHFHLRSHPDLIAWPDPAAKTGDAARALSTLACTAAAFGFAFIAPGYNMLALVPVLFLGLLRMQGRRAYAAAPHEPEHGE